MRPAPTATTSTRLPPSHPPLPKCSLGFYRTEEAAARGYDVVAAWRNRQLAAALAERQKIPRRRRRRRSAGGAGAGSGRNQGGGGSTSQPASAFNTAAGEASDDEEVEEQGSGSQTPRRLMTNLLPLNLPSEAPPAGDDQQQGDLESVLDAVRGECARDVRRVVSGG